MSKVKCADCGFLATRNLTNRAIDEAEDFFRESGMSAPIFSKQATGGEILTDGKVIQAVYPVCFARSYDINNLCFELCLKQNYTAEEAIRKVVNDERKCKKFTKWQQGFTPKEHRQMIDAEREQRWHLIELIVFIVVTLGAGIGGAIIGALIARGII